MLVVIAGYLVWIRSKFQPPVSPRIEEAQVTATPSPAMTASPSATPGAKIEATVSAKPSASPAGARR